MLVIERYRRVTERITSSRLQGLGRWRKDVSDPVDEEIEAFLREDRHEDASPASGEIPAGRRQELLEQLKEAADELGKSPTIREFNELDLGVSAYVFRHIFGSWNEAKREAGLQTRQRGTVVPINEDYFSAVDSPPKAYWLGALIAHSSLQKQKKGSNHYLSLGRAADRAYFVREFANEIESGYPINRYEKDEANEQATVMVQISNPQFIQNLLEAGYPTPGDEDAPFPDLETRLRPPFVRGFLESSGYFSTSGWSITMDTIERAETLQGWFTDFGAKRPTISELDSGAIKLRVANVFDIKAIFETCWPRVLDTRPSWEPYPRTVLDHLIEEYPYPENVEYLGDE